jgi:hypothetical protein
MAGMNREEYKAADALSKAVSNRGFQAHGFIIRITEFPAYVQREIWQMFMLWAKVMATESNSTYSLWPDDIRYEAKAIWAEAQAFYDDGGPQ